MRVPRTLLIAVVTALGATLVAPSVWAASVRTLPSGRTTYRDYGDYVSELSALAAGHPGLVRRVVLPQRSVEGRELVGVEIARNVNRDDDGRPVNLIIGLTHGREWPSGEVALEYALDLVARQSDARIAALLAGERTIVVPVSNPDGFVASGAGQPLRRRNCRAVAGDDPAAPCAQHRGVDLNRNYGAFWGGNGASTSPDQDTYRGPGPWSEPEAQAVHELSRALPVTGVVSLHSIAALVLRPPGFRALGLAPDEDRLRTLGDAMGAATGYTSEYAYQLYEVTGAAEDWNYVAQGAFAYTIELGTSDSDRSFQGPYSSHVVDQYLGSGPTAGRGVREALLLGGEEAMDPRDHLVITGQAPAGRVLHLRKSFDTTTSAICQSDISDVTGNCAPTSPAFTVSDGLDMTLTVPADGHVVWNVGPSTRPFVAKAGGSEGWTLTCTASSGLLASHELTAGRGQLAEVSPCDPAGRVRVGANPALGSASARFSVAVGRVSRGVALGRGVPVRVRCAAACAVVASATLRGRRIARVTASVGALARRTLRVRLVSAASRAALRGAPARSALRVSVVAKDLRGSRRLTASVRV